MKLNKFYKSLVVLISSTSLLACNSGASEGNNLGSPNMDSKVQNGSIVKDPFLNSTVPLIVIITPEGNGFCSGTLIDANTVLTAAHCALDMKTKALNKSYTEKNVIKPNNLKIILSKDPSQPIDLYGFEMKNLKLKDVADIYSVKDVYVHQYAFRGAKVAINGFNLTDGSDLNDLAILKLEKEAPNNYGFPKLATKNPNPNTKELIVGYGVNVGDGVKIRDRSEGDSGTLRKADSIFIDSYFDGKLLDVGGFVKRGKKSVYSKICSGDSGGPDFQKIKGDYVITGVHSFGDGDDCGMPDTPSTSMSVAAYSNWISGGYKTQSISN